MTSRNRRVIKIERPVDETATEPFGVAESRPKPHKDVTFRPRGPRDARRTPPRRNAKRRPVGLLVGLGVICVLAAGVAFAVVTAHHTTKPAVATTTISTTEPSTAVSIASTPTPKPRKTKPKPHRTAAKAPKKTVSSASSTVATHVSTKTTAVVSVASISGTVVIDAGHQGHGDSSLEPIGPGSSEKKPKVADGASGPFAPHDESEVNLEVALKLQKVLKDRGVKVVMVRTKQNVNISNSQRAAIANKAHAALFIRLHCDGISDSSKHGLSTLIPVKNQWTGPIVGKSATAGRMVHRAALAATGASDAGVVNRGDLSGFNWSKVPTILVEMGFMSNRTEDRNLVSPKYQQKLATGMANGVVQYLKSR